MRPQNNSPSPQEAQQLLTQADSVGTAAISNHGRPAMVFNSLALPGSLLSSLLSYVPLYLAAAFRELRA